jgi:glutathione peroxidase
MSNSIYDIRVEQIDGQKTTLQPYQGKVLLIVNTASACGFTPQYEGLQTLYKHYADKGLIVLGFPCNQFGAQEPGMPSEIADFCHTRFQVEFPLFAKIEVNGPNTHPLYQHLKSSSKGFWGTESIKWNFTKFLVDRNGNIGGRYGSVTKPASLIPVIEKLLNNKT